MAWSTPGTAVSGATATAAFWNTNVRDNLNAGFPDAVSAASWTPALEATTSVFGDTPTVTARQWRVGAVIYLWARFVMTGGSNGAGIYFVTLPVSSSGITSGASSGQTIGTVQCVDASGVALSQAGAVRLRAADEAAFFVDGANVTETTPFTWALNDVLTFFASYPIA